MNRHEHRYRWTGWALLVLLGLWVATMLLAPAIPSKLWKTGLPYPLIFEGIFPVLFVAALVIGAMRMVAYVRWTGKYPYYFLFSKSHLPRKPEDKA